MSQLRGNRTLAALAMGLLVILGTLALVAFAGLDKGIAEIAVYTEAVLTAGGSIIIPDETRGERGG